MIKIHSGIKINSGILLLFRRNPHPDFLGQSLFMPVVATQLLKAPSFSKMFQFEHLLYSHQVYDLKDLTLVIHLIF